MIDILDKFPFTEPDRVILDDITGDMIIEWQEDNYFEISKEPEEDFYEIMIENDKGEFEHWELKKLK